MVPKLSFLVFIVQSMFLFVTLAVISCAHTADADIDIKMWKFLWVPHEEKKQAFGTLLSHQNIMRFFLLPIQNRALAIMFSLFFLAKILVQRKSTREKFYLALRGSLLGTFLLSLF